jgi:diguanylate cyclase (GGDEF)-like protein
MIGLFVIVIAITLSKVLSKGLSTPLNTLMTLTKRISRGELEVPKLNQKLPTEFTDLYQGFVLMSSAIVQREEEIKYQAERDLLTGLYNRYKILNEIQNYINNNIHLLIVTFNIKNFTTVNDTVGFKNADAVLVELAFRTNAFIDTCQNNINNKGFAARINSDEFLVCLPIDNIDLIDLHIEKLRAELEQPFIVSDITLNVCLYYGVSNSIEHGLDAEDLVRRSTMAASAASKNNECIKFYQQGEDEEYLNKLYLIEELKLALDNSDSPLFMNYQPKLNIATGQVDKLEALIRWINKKGNFVNPEVFVGLAEQSGLIVTLTRWVILNVIKQVAQWNSLGHKFQVSINLSAQDIQDPDFVEYLLTTLDNYKVEPHQITLELTERDLAENEALVAARLTHLKSLGFQVSVDDYGIGQSSLAKLKHLPVDELKIDKTFILRLDQSKQDQDIVSSTISLGHKLGLRVVAEGVENKASLNLLQQFNCDYVQGYYLSRPLNPDRLIEWCTSYEIPN